MDEMIEITERARHRASCRSSGSPGRPAGRRQGRRLLGLATFAFDAAPRPTDHVFEGPDGVKVYIDPRSLRLLDGTVLDFDEHNLMATNFTLRNPHAKSTCGCGESFSA